jgi:hypothetical protein
MRKPHQAISVPLYFKKASFCKDFINLGDPHTVKHHNTVRKLYIGVLLGISAAISQVPHLDLSGSVVVPAVKMKTFKKNMEEKNKITLCDDKIESLGRKIYILEKRRLGANIVKKNTS